VRIYDDFGKLCHERERIASAIIYVFFQIFQVIHDKSIKGDTKNMSKYHTKCSDCQEKGCSDRKKAADQPRTAADKWKARKETYTEIYRMLQELKSAIDHEAQQSNITKVFASPERLAKLSSEEIEDISDNQFRKSLAIDESLGRMSAFEIARRFQE